MEVSAGAEGVAAGLNSKVNSGGGVGLLVAEVAVCLGAEASGVGAGVGLT